MKKTIKSLNIIIVLLPFLALLSTKSISDTETTSALTTIEIPTTLLPNHPTENVTLATVMKIQENVKKNNSNDENLKNIEGSSTTQDPKSLLIPPALVEAKIFQMNSSKKALKLQT